MEQNFPEAAFACSQDVRRVVDCDSLCIPDRSTSTSLFRSRGNFRQRFVNAVGTLNHDRRGLGISGRLSAFETTDSLWTQGFDTEPQ